MRSENTTVTYPNGKKRVSANLITGELRRAIVAGEYNGGDRLPSYSELEKRFDTTRITVNRALQKLAQDGFVQGKRGSGTYVTDHPPHVSHYALVFPSGSNDRKSQFYAALHQEGGRLQRPERRISMFHNIAGHVDVEDYQRLLSHIRSHRLAGIVFAFTPFMLQGSPLLEEPGIPRVVIGTPYPGSRFPQVYPDLAAFLPKAMAYLASHGRKRVAMLVLARPEAEISKDVSEYQKLAATYGLELPAHWVQGIHPEAASWARQSVLLLVNRSPSERPDALIILDDNLLETATAGLADSGVPVPSELKVIALTNFPWPTPSYVPVKRLGYDISRLLAVCLERIDQQRRGEKPPMATLLPPQFEEDFVVTSTRAAGVAKGCTA